MPRSSLPQRVARRTVRSWRSRNCYEDQVKRRIALTGIGRQSRQREASGRDSWRSSARKAGRKLEAERHEAAKERRRRQKVQWGVRIRTRTLQPVTSVRELSSTFPNLRLRGISHLMSPPLILLLKMVIIIVFTVIRCLSLFKRRQARDSPIKDRLHV